MSLSVVEDKQGKIEKKRKTNCSLNSGYVKKESERTTEERGRRETGVGGTNSLFALTQLRRGGAIAGPPLRHP